MSDPVTNVEIEDVLSSIRRLVSDGDKARTRDPAPIELPDKASVHTPEISVAASESKASGAVSDRLVLTPAFLVVDTPKREEEAHEDVLDVVEKVVEDEAWADEVEDDVETSDDVVDDAPEETDDSDEEESDDPLPLTEMVWEDVDDDTNHEAEAAPGSTTETPERRAPDRSGLVATIAELEAAISAGDDDYEPDGSEEMSETIAWPGAKARDDDSIEEAEVSNEVGGDQSDEAPEMEDIAEAVAAVTPNDEAPENSTEVAVETDIQEDIDAAGADEYDDELDDLDGLADAGAATLDEDALRALVSEIVREELTGPMGERITRNVRKLVRREIYRILSSQEFD